jgi:hypothetical protein
MRASCVPFRLLSLLLLNPHKSLRSYLVPMPGTLQQICSRLNRRAAPKAAPDRAGSLPASPTFLRIAVKAVEAVS